jgi:hypothetical protein
MLTTGMHVQIHHPGVLPAAFGKVVGFYCDEPRRALVVLPSGESLVLMVTDVSPVNGAISRAMHAEGAPRQVSAPSTASQPQVARVAPQGSRAIPECKRP